MRLQELASALSIFHDCKKDTDTAYLQRWFLALFSLFFSFTVCFIFFSYNIVFGYVVPFSVTFDPRSIQVSPLCMFPLCYHAI
jgi:hypothetical protein